MTLVLYIPIIFNGGFVCGLRGRVNGAKGGGGKA